VEGHSLLVRVQKAGFENYPEEVMTRKALKMIGLN
jgi:hypothetical protein